MPGPGHYDNLFKKASKHLITLKSRKKMFNDIPPDDTPAANHYSVKEAFVTPGRFKAISFGYGHKYDFTKRDLDAPGPG
eukprot:CAMPEP_0114596498 /NCGR_PEP_ID=MMETSP0125-20121206/18519_1 /TAXON_ID=485358 ORGANISM="Aristerostoma sp., Strain ATCC 50986" /NCGR_SAMPLE_ID=MMETSP0125 /ASSEMBLY_ACC=CAM_ASM_000245 /LENGTH=78 /DNA_ID=CAMNT_0001799591 /DNA_START=161 /DNA_END=397 /DNA_ORIENTATION=+